MTDRVKTIEPTTERIPRFGEMASSYSSHNLTNACVGFLFSATGPLAILLAVATVGGLSDRDIESWIFAGYGLGGVLSIFFSLRYRQPLTLAWTIPGAVLLGPALGQFAFDELIGAYLAAGVLISLLGITGLIRPVMRAIPLPIVMSMVAGVFLPFCLKIISAFESAFWMALAMLVAFAAISAVSRLSRIIPPVLGALIAGGIVFIFTGELAADRDIVFGIAAPVLYTPRFSLEALTALTIPIAITVIGIHNAQAFAILKNAGYSAPQNALTLGCGLGSLVFGLLGSVPTCVTGPVNAILNNSGPKAHRYLGGVTYGVLMILFGLFAPITTSVALALPVAFIGMLGGLGLLHILRDAFRAAFTGPFSLGALVTFLVTISDIAIFNIGAAFWGLAFGYLTSWLLERHDFKNISREND